MAKSKSVSEESVTEVVAEEAPVTVEPCRCSEEARHAGEELRKAERVERELAQAGVGTKRWD